VAGACSAPGPAVTDHPSPHVSKHDARYRFVDVASDVGVGQVTRTWGAAWVDFEGDGDPDVFLGRHWREPLLLQGSAGAFDTLPTPPDLAGTEMDRHQCAWGEANHDGDPDLFCTQGADRGQGRGPNQLLINKGGILEDQAARYGVTYARARGRSVNWVDYDVDGDLDAFFGSTERRGYPMELFERGRYKFRKANVGLSKELSVLASSWADWDRDGDFDLLITQHRRAPTLAFENVGGRRFRKVRLPAITGRSWTAGSWGDFNADGWPDLQLVARDVVRIFRNVGGGLRPVFKARLREGRAGTWFDVDNDGDLDSFVVQGAKGNFDLGRDGRTNARDLLLIRRRGGFDKVKRDSFRGSLNGNGEVATAADYDRDGRVDIFVTNGLHHWKGPLELLRNVSRAQNWAAVDIVGPNKNPLGYGAIVRWKTRDRVFERQLGDEVVFKGQSEVGYVHLGLGKSMSADVKIRWLRGPASCATVQAGTIVEIVKGAGSCR
jgi:hypothetical protein